MTATVSSPLPMQLPAAGCAAASRHLPNECCPAYSRRRCRCGRGCGRSDGGLRLLRGMPRTRADRATPGTPISPGRRSSRSGSRWGRSSGSSCSAIGGSAGGCSDRASCGASCSPPPAHAADSRTTAHSLSSGCSRTGSFLGRSRSGSGLPTRGSRLLCAASLHGAQSTARSAAQDASRRAVDVWACSETPRTLFPCASGSRTSASGSSSSGGGRSLRCRSRTGSGLPIWRRCWVVFEGLLLGRRGGQTVGQARLRTDVVSPPESIRPV